MKLKLKKLKTYKPAYYEKEKIKALEKAQGKGVVVEKDMKKKE